MDATSYSLGLQLFITPGAARDEMDTANGIIVALGKEIAASKAPADFKQAYAIFYDEWRGFFDRYKEGLTAWFARGFSVTYDKILDYKRRAKEWNARFRALGFATQIEVPSGAGVNRQFPWMAVAIGGGVILGSVLVLRAFMPRGSREY